MRKLKITEPNRLTVGNSRKAYDKLPLAVVLDKYAVYTT